MAKFYPTQEQEKEIIRLYVDEKKSSIEISAIFSCSKGLILKILRQNNIKRRTLKEAKKNTVNVNYFDVIDTEAKAYFFGLFCADGYNGDNGITISLIEEDGYILEDFKKDINHFYPLYYRKDSLKNPKLSNKTIISIYSKKLAAQLSKLGAIRKKSLVLKFPSYDIVSEHLFHHFIRGYFDGDGSVSCGNYKKQSTIQFDFTSSKHFCDELKLFLKTIGINTILRQRFKNCEAYSLQGGATNQSFLLYKFLYKDATYFLRRKKQIFECFFKYKNYSDDGFNQNKKSKFRGVTKSKNKSFPWKSQIICNGIKYDLGKHKTEEEAAKAYDNMIIKLLGKTNSKLNFRN